MSTLKTDIVTKINSIVDASTREIWKIFRENNMHYGDIKNLAIYKRPDDHTSVLTNKAKLEGKRDFAIETFFHERCIHHDIEPMKINNLYTDEEVQAFYDKTQKELEEKLNSPEYKEYLRLKQKFERPILIMDVAR